MIKYDRVLGQPMMLCSFLANMAREFSRLVYLDLLSYTVFTSAVEVVAVLMKYSSRRDSWKLFIVPSFLWTTNWLPWSLYIFL
jgi:hypothetical protein